MTQISLPQESTDLALHVDACEQRYQQLYTRLCAVEQRLTDMARDLKTIGDIIQRDRQNTLRTYLTGSLALVGVLTAVSGVLIARYVL
jgi:hypothetical protein